MYIVMAIYETFIITRYRIKYLAFIFVIITKTS